MYGVDGGLARSYTDARDGEIHAPICSLQCGIAHSPAKLDRSGQVREIRSFRPTGPFCGVHSVIRLDFSVNGDMSLLCLYQLDLCAWSTVQL